jgi:DNA-binding SARP family transcriptional activator
VTDIQFLGPVRVFHANPGPAPQQAVLVTLAAKAGQVLAVDELADAGPISRVRTYVAGLRRVMRQAGVDGRSVLASVSDGYVLRVEPDQVDVWHFDRLFRRGQAMLAVGDAGGAADVLASALALWRGEALSGVPGLPAERERARLEERRLLATEELVRARMRLNESDLVAELAHLVRCHPGRESLRELLMIALVRGGRRAEALLVLHDSRQKPGPALLRIQDRILADDDAFFEAS